MWNVGLGVVGGGGGYLPKVIWVTGNAAATRTAQTKERRRDGGLSDFWPTPLFVQCFDKSGARHSPTPHMTPQQAPRFDILTDVACPREMDVNGRRNLTDATVWLAGRVQWRKKKKKSHIIGKRESARLTDCVPLDVENRMRVKVGDWPRQSVIMFNCITAREGKTRTCKPGLPIVVSRRPEWKHPNGDHSNGAIKSRVSIDCSNILVVYDKKKK